eukprot:NODE_727_length_4406_cov_0.729046.p3 type:complete len:172 gc:universal NODE_727_length_4406_cov_0.729046:3760-4275(+)
MNYYDLELSEISRIYKETLTELHALEMVNPKLQDIQFQINLIRDTLHQFGVLVLDHDIDADSMTIQEAQGLVEEKGITSAKLGIVTKWIDSVTDDSKEVTLQQLTKLTKSIPEKPEVQLGLSKIFKQSDTVHSADKSTAESEITNPARSLIVRHNDHATTHIKAKHDIPLV